MGLLSVEARAEIHSAPPKIPIFVMDVMSINTISCKRCALPAWLQNAFAAGSNNPAALTILAAHSPKPYTTPQGCPAMRRLSAASTANAKAPTSHLRSHQVRPLPTQSLVARPNIAKPTSVITIAFRLPNSVTSPIGSTCPSLSQSPTWTEPRKLPKANKGKIPIFIGMPRPALYNVPDPQPSAICMVRPNTKAPINKLMLGGPSAAVSSEYCPSNVNENTDASASSTS